MARVKICGICTQAALDAAAEADWVGFVFFSASPRYLAPAQAAALSGGPPKVGLFVDPTDTEVETTLAAIALDILQIHAPPGRAAAIRTRFGLPVWHAVGVQARSDLPSSMAADAILLDAQAPPGATRPGGNARPFDWSLLTGWRPPGPWLLAGGLTPDNVADAIRISAAPAVDVSSGVEHARGIKDPALIRAFIAAAKAA